MGHLVISIGLFYQSGHKVQTFFDNTQIPFRKSQSVFEHSAPHGSEGLIQNIDQGHPIGTVRLKQFQIPHRKTIHPDIFFLKNPLDRSDVRDLIVIRFPEVMQYGSGSNHSGLHIFYTKTFQSQGLKMGGQSLQGISAFKNPILQIKDIELFSHLICKSFFGRFGYQHFSGSKILQQLFDLNGISLRDPIIACRDV